MSNLFSSQVHPCMANSSHLVSLAPALSAAGLIGPVITFLTTLRGEFDPVLAVRDAEAAYPAGGWKGVLAAWIADAANVFPDSLTRPGIVLGLGLLERLTPAPHPQPAPAPAPLPAPGPVPLP